MPELPLNDVATFKESGEFDFPLILNWWIFLAFILAIQNLSLKFPAEVDNLFKIICIHKAEKILNHRTIFTGANSEM